MATTRTHRETTAPRATHSAPAGGGTVHTRMAPQGLPVGVAANDERGRGIRPGELGAIEERRDQAYPAGSPLPCG
ncbi:hypothetical protein [Nocardia rhamnosiphila]